MNDSVEMTENTRGVDPKNEKETLQGRHRFLMFVFVVVVAVAASVCEHLRQIEA